MLKKRLGIEVIEKDWYWYQNVRLYWYFKFPPTLIIPEGCKKIGRCALWCCEELRDVTIPESVEVIEDSAFKWCKNLENVVIPGSVKEIGDNAFGCCVKAKIILGKPRSKFKYIGWFAFDGCKVC